MWKGTGKGNYNNALKTYLKAKDHASGNAGEKKPTTELNSLGTNKGNSLGNTQENTRCENSLDIKGKHRKWLSKKQQITCGNASRAHGERTRKENQGATNSMETT